MRQGSLELTKRVWLLLAMLPLLGGCPEIYSEQPLGEVVVLKPEEVNGLWQIAHKEGGFAVSVVDAANGVIAFQEYSCQSLPHSIPDEVKVPLQLRLWRSTNRKEWYFPTDVENRGQADSQAKLASLFKYEVFFLRTDASVVLVYGVAVDRVKSLVEKGVLPGRVEGGDVILGPLSPEHYDVLLSEEHPLVNWQSPNFVLIKVPPRLNPCGT